MTSYLPVLFSLQLPAHVDLGKELLIQSLLIYYFLLEKYYFNSF